MSDKVEVVANGLSVVVSHEFYRVAAGLLTMGLPVLDVFRDEGDDFFSIVFPSSDSMEHFSVFLLTHRLFVDGDGQNPMVNGDFSLETDGDSVSMVYLLVVEDRHFSALEECLVSHAPGLSPASQN